MVPIFIIGTERSGTNLLRLILNAHSGIAVPHPPHIMKLFTPLVPRYGDLGQDARFRKLIEDVCRMVELHPYPWELRLDREKIFRQAKGRDLISVYFAIYDRYREQSGKRRWACKSTFMIEHVAEILQYHPEAKFIYLVRDGRDVAVSARASIFNRYHVYYAARRWKGEQQLGLSWLRVLPQDRILLLKYEDLIADPAEAVRRLCSFLGEPNEDAMLDYHRSPEARKSGSLSLSWENTSRPVISGNAGKFRTCLSEQEIMLFEGIAHEELQQLGYPLVNPAERLAEQRATITRPRLKYLFSELMLSLKAEAAHFLNDRSALARFRKGIYMRYLRAVRGLPF